METVFKKSNLPLLERTLHAGKGREWWSLARLMQDGNGLQHQLPAELSLLLRGADKGDAWAMCELARSYFHHAGDLFLPEALRLWKRAALLGDEGARYDLQSNPIRERILAYQSPDGNRYTAIEIKCALLSELHLSAFGLSPFSRVDRGEQVARCRALFDDACCVLQIPYAQLSVLPHLSFGGQSVDGLAYRENKIEVCEAVLDHMERLIQVLFHELGHLIVFAIQAGGENANILQALYGITDARILSWANNEMGEEVSTGEEDPDTLSYGVYAMWATFFCDLN